MFSGTAGLQTGDGEISLLAGNNVTVGSGYVRTINGGDISVTAVSGSVNTGSNPNGYDFRPTGTGYVVDANLGGISTADGGNVNITAGTDIISYLPVAGGVETDAGTGCFGAAPGNLTLDRRAKCHRPLRRGQRHRHHHGDQQCWHGGQAAGIEPD